MQPNTSSNVLQKIKESTCQPKTPTAAKENVLSLKLGTQNSQGFLQQATTTATPSTYSGS